MARRKTSSESKQARIALEAFVESLRWLQPIDQIGQQIVEHIHSGFDVAWCGLLLRDDVRARLSLAHMAGPVPGPVTLIPIDDPQLKRLEHLNRTFRIPNTRTWHEWKEPGIAIALPLIENERWIGLILIGKRRGKWMRSDLSLLNKLRRRAGVAIENGRRYRAAIQSRDDLATVFKVSMVASSVLDTSILLDRLGRHINDALGMDGITLSAWDQEHDQLLNWMSYRRKTFDLNETQDSSVALSELPVAREIMFDRAPRIVSPVHSRSMPLETKWLSERGIAQMLLLPLVARDAVIGLVRLYTLDASHKFQPADVQLAQTLGAQAALAIDNAHLIEELREAAHMLEQKVAERTEELEHIVRNQMVEASKTHAIIESVNDGVFVIDATRTVTLVNAAAEEILERPREQLLGLRLGELAEVLGEAPLPWVRAMQEWIGGESTHEERIKLDERTISIILSPVHLDGESQGLVNVLRDVTRDVQLNQAKSEFVATVSHEIRTPMTSIRGYIDLIIKEVVGPVTREQLEFLKVVHRNIIRLAVLVDDLLDLSRIETGRVQLRLERLTLDELVSDVAITLMPRVEEQQHRLDVQVPADLPAIRGDASRLTQVLTNLISNAIAYTPQGGKITVKAHADDLFAVVDVVDTGVGISDEDRHRVFERFFRADNPTVHAAKGTGLGLPIVQQLIKLHGGRIWVNSDGVPGQGSTFSFSLPLWEADINGSSAIADEVSNG